MNGYVNGYENDFVAKGELRSKSDSTSMSDPVMSTSLENRRTGDAGGVRLSFEGSTAVAAERATSTRRSAFAIFARARTFAEKILDRPFRPRVGVVGGGGIVVTNGT